MITFKTLQVQERFQKINNKLIHIAKEMDEWLVANYNSDLVITSALSTKEEDDALKRVSSSHREGRAFDVSLRGWSNDMLEEFVQLFGMKYHNMGAPSKSDGLRRFLVIKPHGTGPHIHVQIGKDIA